MSAGPQLQPFAEPPSAELEDEFRELVATQYGPVKGWQILGGEEDFNARVERERGPALLKVSWADQYGFADFQTELIDYLSVQVPSLPVPAVIPTLHGARSLVSDRIDHRPLYIRMTTFLPGVSARGKALPFGLLYKIGELLARLDESLAKFPSGVPGRPTNWNIMSAGRVLADLVSAHVADRDEEHRTWGAVLEEFVGTTLPALAKWPAQVIHNDLNGSNLLLDFAAHEVTGLFDFGDVVEAPRIVDLAVAAAYLADGHSTETIFASLASIVGGYQSRSELTPEEVAIVPEIMKARCALALTLNHARAAAAEDPSHAQYVLRNSVHSRTKLAVLIDPAASRMGRRLAETLIR